MRAFTSISPKHILPEAQSRAIASWEALELKVHSFNHPSEVAKLKWDYPTVNFIETVRTQEAALGKPYVLINAFLDWFKLNAPDEVVMLLNSDIVLAGEPRLLQKVVAKASLGMVAIRRCDMQSGHPYVAGLDGFVFSTRFLNIYPQAIFCLGQTWWDYWFPFHALQNGIPMWLVDKGFAKHEAHNAQYSQEQHARMERYFIWENEDKLKKHSSVNVGARVIKYINQSMRLIE